MAEPKLREVLARVARELEDEEVAEEFEELKNRKPTWDEFAALLRETTPEQRAEIREILADEGVSENGKVEDEEDDDAEEKKPAAKKPPVENKAPARRKRPGRLSGNAYDWYIDDDGEVVRSPVAVIYSGEDEPDEVEMLDTPSHAIEEGEE